MKIKEQCRIWLPKDADPTDLVLGATQTPGAKAHIMLHIRRKDGRIDSVLLILPANGLENALATINQNTGLTVREVGELEVLLM